MKFKREYILYHMNPKANEGWFYDEPYETKEEMESRIALLSLIRKEKIRIKRRFTIEI